MRKNNRIFYLSIIAILLGSANTIQAQISLPDRAGVGEEALEPQIGTGELHQEVEEQHSSENVSELQRVRNEASRSNSTGNVPTAEGDDGETGEEPIDLGRLDLAAQESMARSTFQMAVVAWLGLVLTSVGVLLIASTLVATRDAARHAKAAADAAEAAVAETRRLGEAQVTAYVTIRDVVLLVGHRRAGLTMKVVNTGQSPAEGCIAKVCIRFTPGNRADRHEVSDTIFVGDIGPANEFPIEHDTIIDFGLFGIVNSGEFTISLEVDMIYFDVFARERNLGPKNFAAIDEYEIIGAGLKVKLRPAPSEKQNR